MRICIALLLSALIMGGLPSFAQAFDFDDLEKIEKAEQEDLLAKAGQAALDWNFDEARSLLKQAQQKGYAPAEVETVEKLIADNESAKAEQEDLLAKAGQAARDWNFDEARSLLKQAQQKGHAPAEIETVEKLIADNESAKAEQERRAEEERQAQIAAQEAAQRQNAAPSSSGGGGGSPDYVQIEVSCRSPMCNDTDLQVSSSSGSDRGFGRFEWNFTGGAIFKGYDGRLDGVYDYSVRLEPFTAPHVVCSGSFTLNGSEERVYLNFNPDCSDAGSSMQ